MQKRFLAAQSPTGRLLDLLLEAPDLVEQVRALPGPAVSALVQRVGLEDAGEVLALFTTDQLTELLDDVLWSGDAPGADETFDARRFATWLEVMLEAGDEFCADRLADLSEDLLAVAVSRLAMVLDLSEVEAEAGGVCEGDLVEKVLDSSLHQELGGYFLVARQHEGWDALVASLLALDARHAHLLECILHRCWVAAHEQLDNAGGLYDLLTGEELLEVDAAAEREDRRAVRGYVSPASGRAFLALAAQGVAGLAPGQEDAVSRAYFRELDRTVRNAMVARHRDAPVSCSQEVAGLLAGSLEAMVPVAPRPATPGLLREWMHQLAFDDPARHARAVEELAFLANVLVVGDDSRARPWRAAEAAEQVLATCEQGLGWLAAPGEPTSETLAVWGPLAAFRAGFAKAKAS